MTLPEAGMLMAKPLKMAEGPEKLAEPTGLPLSERTSPLIPEGFPVPLSVTVKLVKFTVVFPVLVKTTRMTGTLEAPGNWVELGGAGDPRLTWTVAGVMVEVGVTVNVGLLVGVDVAIAMVIVAPFKGRPLKLAGCPLDPDTVFKLN